MNITQDLLHELFVYKDDTLYWRVDRGSNKTKGKEVGNVAQHGYRVTSINGKKQYIHRIIWAMFNGTCEKTLSIDHIDGNPLNNNIDNLREVTHQENMWNRKNVKGYWRNSKINKWCANIQLNRKTIHLGSFDSEQEAHSAYLRAKEMYHKAPTTVSGTPWQEEVTEAA